MSGAFQATAFFTGAFEVTATVGAFEPSAFYSGGFQTVSEPAFDGSAFETTAFYATTVTAAPAFDGGAFYDQGFYATPNGAVVANPAFDGTAFNDNAFYATETPAAQAFPMEYGGHRSRRKSPPVVQDPTVWYDDEIVALLMVA